MTAVNDVLLEALFGLMSVSLINVKCDNTYMQDNYHERVGLKGTYLAEG